MSMFTKTIGSEELGEVAHIHMVAFKDSALTKLGEEAVRRFYSSLLSSNHEVSTLGAYQANELAGFCLGGVFRGELSFFLLQNKIFLARRVLIRPWLLNNPIFRSRIKLALRLLKHPERMESTLEDSSPIVATSFGIQSIAVDPKYQGRGVGKMLMEATEKEAVNRGFEKMHLTVHRNNEQAIRFYEGTGWTKEIINDQWNEVMRKSLVALRETT